MFLKHSFIASVLILNNLSFNYPCFCFGGSVLFSLLLSFSLSTYDELGLDDIAVEHLDEEPFRNPNLNDLFGLLLMSD